MMEVLAMLMPVTIALLVYIHKMDKTLMKLSGIQDAMDTRIAKVEHHFDLAAGPAGCMVRIAKLEQGIGEAR